MDLKLKTDPEHIFALGIAAFGLQLVLGVFVLVPVQGACQYTATCSLLNLNPYIGALYIGLGSVSYFEFGGEVIRNRRWLLTALTLVPILATFLEFDLTQGGQFGTFRVGGITLEHEGFALGMIPGAFFFRRDTRLFYGVVGLASFLIFLEYGANALGDLASNPFGIFFSALLGFVFTYAIFRAFGYRELPG